ncbi:MAG: hypothetical protein LBP67_08865 [Bacteroidales bacterium]|nr:hypothetical protein [Bacteroidales bacterium]
MRKTNFKNLFASMIEERIYHIFNQGNNKEDIFRSEENKRYFMEKLNKYIGPFADIGIKCLMNNHFHIVLKIKPYKIMALQIPHVKGLTQVIERHKRIGKRNEDSIIISEMLRRFFMSYAKAFNKMYNRTGSLFRKNFKRKLITTKRYLRNILLYIHKNPKIHKFTDEFINYPWSSYQEYLIGDIKNSFAKQILELFDSQKDYICAHIKYVIEDDDDIIILE